MEKSNVQETRKGTFPGFKKLAGRETHKATSGERVFSFRFDKQLKFMFSCLLEALFVEVLLEGTAVSLVLDTAASGFDESVPARLREGVIERACNTSTNDQITNPVCS